jgi:hypothetical protein
LIEIYNRARSISNKIYAMATIDIPKQQRAAVRVGSGHDARAPVKEIPVEMPGPSEILVKINW